MAINSTADFVRMTRAALAAAGFARHEVDGTVWFANESAAASGERQALSGEDRETPHRSPLTPHPSNRKTIVLLHGVNDQAGTWFNVAPFLARDARVLIPDLAGHGESAPASGAIPISLILDRLDAILAKERDLTLVGNSLGGWIAILYTLRHGDRVSRLVLEASGGLTRPIASPLVATNREEAHVILRNVHGPNFVPPEWVVAALLERATDSPMLRITEAAEHETESRLGELRVPTTLIWGADDGVLPLDYAEELQRAIPGATLHVLEGAAHIPHLQQPERYLQCFTAIS